MRFSLRPLGDFFTFRKGLGYLGKYLQSSDVALVGLNSFEGGGGYKEGGEKEYSGPFKPEHRARAGELFISTTDITQDGRVLASPFLMPDLSRKYREVIFSGDIVKADSIREGLDPEFVYNVLRVRAFRQKAAYASTGSTVRRIPTEVLERLEVPVPSLQMQKAINKIVRSIDSKIEVNSSISVSTEQIAESIFKSWFIDFDPVHAKTRGEQPEGMDAETAALFPDSFEESELGLIPSGWYVSDVGSTLQVSGGSTPSTRRAEYWGGPHQWTTPKDMSSLFGLVSLSSSRSLTDEGLAKITSGLLDRDSVLMSSRAPIGYLAIADSPTAINQGVIAISPHASFPPLYLANWLRAAMPQIESRAGGSSFAEIGKASFRTIPFLVPPENLLSAFREFSGPLLAQLKNLAHQNVSLPEIRDSLLPRLISGELEIPEELLVD
jgi:type I restriction enzyme S subunit